MRGELGSRQRAFVVALVPFAVSVLAACGSSSQLARTTLPSSSSSGRVVLVRGLENAQAYAAGGRLWVAQQVSRPGSVVLSSLMTVNPISGRVEGRRRLDSAFDQALLSHSVLWVTTTRGEISWMWQLDPRSLAVRSRRVLPGSGLGDGTGATMALAGGWLWVGNARELDRVSLTGGQVSAAVSVRDAGGIDVAADAAGRVLIVSEGHGRARVQRRDVRTGRLIAQSPIYEGVTKPAIGGVFGGGVWISAAGGMMGSIERLSLRTLRPTRFAGAQPHPGITAPPEIFGTSGIGARVLDGVIWVTQFAGGPKNNYCGDPVTGRSRSPLTLGWQAQLLTVDPHSVYYIVNASHPIGQELARAAINPRCHPVHEVLAADGIGQVTFGSAPVVVTRLLTSLMGRPPSRPYHSSVICRVDHAIQWPGLAASFAHNRFVGYQYWSTTARPQPTLVTTHGLGVGDTVTRARQLYGRRFTTNAAQGGSWTAHTTTGNLFGYLTGPPSQRPHDKIASIAAGHVGCPAVTP